MLPIKEVTRYRAHLAQALLNQVRNITIEYIDETPYLQDDLSDKGWEEVVEAYMRASDGLTFSYPDS